MAEIRDIVLDGLNSSQISAAASVLDRPAEEFGNSEQIEMQWAMKAYHHAETYFNLISSLDPRILRLTKHDDQIYQKFKEDFPDLKVDVLNQDELKSAVGKEKWRPFCEYFKEQVEDYNFASLIRTDCSKDYSEDNSFIVPKVQFLALEITRNREGCNSCLRAKFGKKKDS